MNESILRAFCKERGLSNEQAEQAVASVAALEQWLRERHSSLERATVDLIRPYLRGLIEAGQNHPETLLALERYFFLTGRNDIYIYFTSLLGGEGVVESIRKRLADRADAKTGDSVFGSLVRPPLGSEPADFPEFTRRLMERLEASLPEQTVRCVLAGNHHGIPASAFEEEARLYRQASSLDAYLLARHGRQVATLQRHCDTKTVWFEQDVTQRVVDYVADNPEILSAVRKGDVLYTTKVPYDPDRYLETDDPVLKRYHACHCPFVREAILRGEPAISPNWCYCSGGFVKYPYEVILGRELRVTLLESVLKGDFVCRFAIDLRDNALST